MSGYFECWYVSEWRMDVHTSCFLESHGFPLNNGAVPSAVVTWTLVGAAWRLSDAVSPGLCVRASSAASSSAMT